MLRKIVSGLQHHRPPRVVHDPKFEAITHLFDLADTDNSGVISAPEFKSALELMGFAQGKMTEDDMNTLCDRLFFDVDTKGTEGIEFSDFREAISPLFSDSGEYVECRAHY